MHEVAVQLRPAAQPRVARHRDALVDLVLGARDDRIRVVPALAQHVRGDPDHRVVAARLGADRGPAEQRGSEREPVRVVLAPGHARAQLPARVRVLALGVHRRALERLDLERDAKRLEALLEQGCLVRVRVRLVDHRQDVLARAVVADPVAVGVVLRLRHGLLGGRDVPATVRRGVGVVVGQLVALEAVHHDVPCELAEQRAAAELPEAFLVQRVVQGDPNVLVVERRRREVHLDVPNGIRGIRVDLVLELGIARVLPDLLGRRHAVEHHGRSIGGMTSRGLLDEGLFPADARI